MNILFISGHPAQIHHFRPVKAELEKQGHSVFWLATDKDISNYLLEYYEITYEKLIKPGKSILSKAWYLFRNTLICHKMIKSCKIDMIISRVSPYAAVAGFISRTPHIAFADTESSGIYDSIFVRFIPVFITAQSYKRRLKKNQIRFYGNIELFYLHPDIFTPVKKEEVFNLLNLKPTDRYVIIRFVSWNAYHDKGLSGFTDENKVRAVQEFSKFTKVFISSEKKIPEELEPYQIKIPPEKMHDVLAHTTLFFGESGTMASEAAVLGRPAIYLNNNWLGYLQEERESGLLLCFKQNTNDQSSSIKQGKELLINPNLQDIWKKKHENFVKDKINPTSFLVWFIEEYPESYKIISKNPEYQLKFK